MSQSEPIELHGAAAVNYAKRLRKVHANPQTWEIEYVDDATGDSWVMDYPQSELQGGGNPRLRRR
jgi:hypothetical protein